MISEKVKPHPSLESRGHGPYIRASEAGETSSNLVLQFSTVLITVVYGIRRKRDRRDEPSTLRARV